MDFKQQFNQYPSLLLSTKCQKQLVEKAPMGTVDRAGVVGQWTGTRDRAGPSIRRTRQPLME